MPLPVTWSPMEIAGEEGGGGGGALECQVKERAKRLSKRSRASVKAGIGKKKKKNDA